MTAWMVGIEIGGTKLQVGVGNKNGELLALAHGSVDPIQGAVGVRNVVISLVDEALKESDRAISDIDRIGIGFGGPIDSKRGVTLRSFQIDGWDAFPLKDWAEEQWQCPVSIQNDASTAGLAEALHGAGRGHSRVFYMTIGSGIGGGWIIDGRIDEWQGLGAAEIGHAWVPDPQTGQPTELEQVCSGWGIGHRAREASTNQPTIMIDLAGSRTQIDAKIVYQAAVAGDALAQRILRETCQTLGLTISNVIALLHPERVIIGGGVSLMGSLFWDQLQTEVKQRAMRAFASSVEILPAELGENVVVIGALCLSH